MKVILNKCFGGFGLSHEAMMLYTKAKKIALFPYENVITSRKYELQKYTNGKCGPDYYFTKDMGEKVCRNEVDWEALFFPDNDTLRKDPDLIKIVEELGREANGRFAELVVVEIPDCLDYVVDDYDGIETLHEAVRVW